MTITYQTKTSEDLVLVSGKRVTEYFYANRDNPTSSDDFWKCYNFPYQPPLIKRYEWDVGDTYELSLTVTYIGLKDSINSGIRYLDKDLDVLKLSLTKEDFTRTRPVKPKDLPLRKYPKYVPKLTLLKERTYWKKPLNLNPKSWEIKLLRLQEKDSIKVARANRLRTDVYVQKLKAYEARLSHIYDLNLKIQQTNISRQEKYLVRLKKYEEALEKATYRKLRSVHQQTVDNINPYRVLMLKPRVPITDFLFSWGYNATSFCATGIELSYLFNTNFSSNKEYCDVCSYAIPWSSYPMVLTSKGDVEKLTESIYRQISELAELAVEDLESRAIRKLYGKLSDGKVHIGNLLAERHQTLSMLGDLFQRSVKLLTAWSKSRLLKTLKNSLTSYNGQAKNLASDVLAFKFGAEPLYNDMQTALETLASAPKLTPEVSVKSRNSRIVKVSLQNGITFEGQVDLNYTARFKIANDVAHDLGSFGLLQPAPILWEITPWSFVIDWVVPVGQFLTALTADVGLSDGKITRAIKLTGTFTFPGDNVTGQSTWSTGLDGESTVSINGGTFDGVWKRREVLATLPDIHKILFIKSPFSWAHGIESVALLVQRLDNLSKIWTKLFK